MRDCGVRRRREARRTLDREKESVPVNLLTNEPSHHALLPASLDPASLLTTPHLLTPSGQPQPACHDTLQHRRASSATQPYFTTRRLLRAFDCVHLAAVDRSMLSSSRFAVMASGFFHSLRSAFLPPPTDPLSTSTTSTSPSSAIDSDTFLPLLSVFQPSNVADVLILAAHHARLQRWDSVHATYDQLASALLMRRDDKQSPVSAAKSVPSSASMMYSPLVSSLSSDEVDWWLAALQQSQRDATMLQPRQHSSRHVDKGNNNHIIKEQAEKRAESPPVVTTSVAGVDAVIEIQQHGALYNEEQQQPTDETLVCETEQQHIIVAGQTPHETEDGSVGVVGAPRKRQRARRKRTKGEWGEMKVPARKRSKRQARKGSRAMDTHAAEGAIMAEEHSTEMAEGGHHSASIRSEGEEGGPRKHATVECSSAEDESNEGATHEIDTDSREPVNVIAKNEQYADRQAENMQEDDQLMEGGKVETVGSTTAMDTLHSRWKRPCKRLVRFRVVAGESEQRQIEALQKEYMKQNGVIPPASSPHSTIEQQQQPTFVTTDPSTDESAIPSHIRTDEQPATDQPSHQSDTIHDTDPHVHLPLDPICPSPSADTCAVPQTFLSPAQPSLLSLTGRALSGVASQMPHTSSLHGTVANVASNAAVFPPPAAPHCLSATVDGFLA